MRTVDGLSYVESAPSSCYKLVRGWLPVSRLYRSSARHCFFCLYHYSGPETVRQCPLLPLPLGNPANPRRGSYFPFLTLSDLVLPAPVRVLPGHHGGLNCSFHGLHVFYAKQFHDRVRLAELIMYLVTLLTVRDPVGDSGSTSSPPSR